MLRNGKFWAELMRVRTVKRMKIKKAAGKCSRLTKFRELP